MTYTMSRDYDALYDHLCAGGEAIAMTTDGLMKASQESQELDGGSRERFSESCTRLSLEWLAPVDLAGVLEAGNIMYSTLQHELGELEVGDSDSGPQTYADQEVASKIISAMAEWEAALYGKPTATAKLRK